MEKIYAILYVFFGLLLITATLFEPSRIFLRQLKIHESIPNSLPEQLLFIAFTMSVLLFLSFIVDIAIGYGFKKNTMKSFKEKVRNSIVDKVIWLLKLYLILIITNILYIFFMILNGHIEKDTDILIRVGIFIFCLGLTNIYYYKIKTRDTKVSECES